MTVITSPPLLVTEHVIPTPHGPLHAMQWSPRTTDEEALVPIVLLHDSLGCVALWRDFPERLAQASGRRVVAYDRLGFGKSAPHPGLLHADFIHDEARGDFRRVRDALNIGRFIAFGHSVGGGMAVGCAAAASDDCMGLGTESAQAFVEDRTLQGIRAAREGFAQPGQVERLAKYHGGKAAWVLAAWIETWLAPAFAGWTLDDDLRRVRCPSLVLHGEHDEFGSAAHPQRIAALTGGPSTLHLLRDRGHVPHREQPDDVLDPLLRWLGEHAIP